MTAKRAFADAVAVMQGDPVHSSLDLLTMDSPLLKNSAEVLADVSQWTAIVTEGPNGYFDRVQREVPHAAPAQ